MRIFKIIITLLVIVGSRTTRAQSLISSITLTHVTVSSVTVIYKAIPQTSFNPQDQNASRLKGIPQVSVSLKENSGATKIYLKIINTSDKSVVYNINYTLSDSPVVSNGKKLFENNNGVIFISSGQDIALKPYTYEIQTENSESNLSTVFSITR